MERRHGQRGVESAEGRHDMHEILQLFRHAFRDPAAAVRRRGGRAPCMIRDPAAAVRRAFVRLLGITQDLSAPAPIARYQTPHLMQNCRSY